MKYKYKEKLWGILLYRFSVSCIPEVKKHFIFVAIMLRPDINLQNDYKLKII